MQIESILLMMNIFHYFVYFKEYLISKLLHQLIVNINS